MSAQLLRQAGLKLLPDPPRRGLQIQRSVWAAILSSADTQVVRRYKLGEGSWLLLPAEILFSYSQDKAGVFQGWKTPFTVGLGWHL